MLAASTSVNADRRSHDDDDDDDGGGDPFSLVRASASSSASDPGSLMLILTLMLILIRTNDAADNNDTVNANATTTIPYYTNYTPLLSGKGMGTHGVGGLPGLGVARRRQQSEHGL